MVSQSTQRAVLQGRYVLEERIGRGAWGEVWRGTQVAVHRSVAVKCLRPEHLGSQVAVARFEREARLLSLVRHANAVRVIDFGCEQDELFLIMDWVAGPTLRRLVLDEGPLPPAFSVELAAGIAAALGAAHDLGLVHRDLKPGNVLVEETSRARRPVVIDFGLARLLEPPEGEATLTRADALLGTPAYMSPEVIEGDEVDGRADIYALGITLLETMTGWNPWRARTGIESITRHLTMATPSCAELVQRGVPGLVAPLVVRMLARDPTDRPRDAHELGEELLAMTRALRRLGPAEAVAAASALGSHEPPATARLADGVAADANEHRVEGRGSTATPAEVRGEATPASGRAGSGQQRYSEARRHRWLAAPLLLACVIAVPLCSAATARRQPTLHSATVAARATESPAVVIGVAQLPSTHAEGYGGRAPRALGSPGSAGADRLAPGDGVPGDVGRSGGRRRPDVRPSGGDDGRTSTAPTASANDAGGSSAGSSSHADSLRRDALTASRVVDEASDDRGQVRTAAANTGQGSSTAELVITARPIARLIVDGVDHGIRSALVLPATPGGRVVVEAEHAGERQRQIVRLGTDERTVCRFRFVGEAPAD